MILSFESHLKSTIKDSFNYDGALFNTSHTTLKQNLPLKETEQSLNSKSVQGLLFPIKFDQVICPDQELSVYFIQESQSFIQSCKLIN